MKDVLKVIGACLVVLAWVVLPATVWVLGP